MLLSMCATRLLLLAMPSHEPPSTVVPHNLLALLRQKYLPPKGGAPGSAFLKHMPSYHEAVVALTTSCDKRKTALSPYKTSDNQQAQNNKRWTSYQQLCQ